VHSCVRKGKERGRSGGGCQTFEKVKPQVGAILDRLCQDCHRGIGANSFAFGINGALRLSIYMTRGD